MDMQTFQAMFGGGGRRVPTGAMQLMPMIRQMMDSRGHGHGHMHIVGGPHTGLPPGLFQHLMNSGLAGPGPGAQRAATDAESKVKALIDDLPNRMLDCDDVPAIDLTADSDDDADASESKKAEDEKEESSCMVCLDGWNAGEEVSMLPCFHQFHKKCVQSWWVRKAKDAAMSSGHANDRAGRAVCPMCRTDVANALAKSREAIKATEVDKNKKKNTKKKAKKRKSTSSNAASSRQPPRQVRAVGAAAAASSDAASAAVPALRVVMPRRPSGYFSDEYDEEMDSDYLGGDDDDDEEDPEELAHALEVASRDRRQQRRGRRAAVSGRGSGSSAAAASGSAASVASSSSNHNLVVDLADSPDDAAPALPNSRRNTRQRRENRSRANGSSRAGASASISPPSTPQSPVLVDSS